MRLNGTIRRMKSLPFAELPPGTPLSAWHDALAGDSQTDSERYLTALARRAFLTLWSYPNVFTDEGRSKGKGDGKELCDLLVIFGNDILIFSDKQCEFIPHADVKVAWGRWYKRAIEKSANQLAGAKSWILRHADRLYLDRQCQHRLPIEIPDLEHCRIHLIAVAKGATEHAARYWETVAVEHAETGMLFDPTSGPRDLLRNSRRSSNVATGRRRSPKRTFVADHMKKARYLLDSGLFNWCRRDESNTRPSHYE